MRILGIDYGNKRVGIAFGDTETQLALPEEVIQNSDTLARDLAQLAKEEFVDQIVVGMPKSLHANQSNEQENKTKDFVERLKKETEIPIDTIDEQNTSLEARRLIKEEGARAEIDALAAMLIVRAYLDELRD